MIPMPPYALPLENIRKPEPLLNLIFRNDFVPILRLSDDEFGDLWGR